MANHPSAIKRNRQSEKKTLQNRYHARTTRSAVKELRDTTKKADAEKLYPKVVAMLDRLSKRNIVHKNKAANLKSKLAKHVTNL